MPSRFAHADRGGDNLHGRQRPALLGLGPRGDGVDGLEAARDAREHRVVAVEARHGRRGDKKLCKKRQQDTNKV